ncbi:MAG: TRAP transporter substrate-binding protein, partial [Pseudomonadota bacterium]
SQVGKQFAECVGTATGGDVTITVHAGGSLFKGNEIKRAVQTGQAPIGERLLSAHQNENAVFGVDSIPFLATTFEQSAALWKAAKPTYEKILDEQNLVLLYATPWPPQGLYFKKEVNSVADMQGVKFRSYNSATARLAELTGMLPVQIEAAEISQAFATGVAESMISSGATGYDRKVWEHLTHFYEVDAWMPRNHVFVNKDAWGGVSDGSKAAIRGCADLAEYAGHWRAVQYTDFTLNGLRSGGMTVAPANDSLVGELNAIGETMAAEWKDAAGSEGQTIVEAFKAQ